MNHLEAIDVIRPIKPRHSPKPLRNFVVWDGEGTQSESGKPQNYSLFGAYNGKSHEYVTAESLTTDECLALITEVATDNPRAIHISFAFGYDVSMILRDLPVSKFAKLKVRNSCMYHGYRIEHLDGKWFTVTKYLDKKHKITAKIFDGWGFFQSSFLKAVRANIPDHEAMADLAIVEQGKQGRSAFTYAEIEFIIKYWKVENILSHALFTRLREHMYSVDLKITSWHGPGALASYAYKHNGIKEHKNDETAPKLYDCSRYAYAGGRFERFHIGRYTSAFGYDINSAYPYAISQLPSLSNGEWRMVRDPITISEYGIYRIVLRGEANSAEASPLFYRDRRGNISFPHYAAGWYWSPEAKICLTDPRATIDVGYEFIPYTDIKPFAFITDTYNQRRVMKANNVGAQMALKLLMNSLYGKMAQRAGWEKDFAAPKWHQLDWAGWVTSKTRASLYEVMQRMDYSQLIAVETDGIYTTASPTQLHLSDSTDLGAWEISEYDELIYLQSGVYAKRQGNKWETKYRGLDSDSLTPTQIIEFTKRLGPLPLGESASWPKLPGKTTRFIGYTNALFRQQQNRGPMKDHLGLWETNEAQIDCGVAGKRRHKRRQCEACNMGATAYEMPHSTIVTPVGIEIHYPTESKPEPGLVPVKQFQGVPFSYRHDIPWLDWDIAEWRKHLDEIEGQYVDGDMFATAEAV